MIKLEIMKSRNMDNTTSRMIEVTTGQADFVCTQKSIPSEYNNIVLNFGPCSVNLETLFFQGWYLGTVPLTHYDRSHGQRRVKIYLMNDDQNTRYSITKISRDQLNHLIATGSSFTSLVKHNKQYIYSVSETPATPADPFDELLERYPQKGKSEMPMIGNQTLTEFLRTELELS